MNRVTIKDIAVHIGVSATAVSAVLKKKEKEARISPKTVKLIQNAASKMGYIPNVAARNLRDSSSGRPLVIALITSYEVPITLAGNILCWLEKSKPHANAMDLRFSFTLEIFHRGTLSALPGIMDNSKFNAAIISNTSPEDDDFLRNVKLPYPAVLINRDIPGYSSICENAAGTGSRAAAILLEQGRKKPAILYSAALTSTTLQRLESFRAECVTHLGREPFSIVSCDFSPAEAYDSIDKFISAGGDFDSIFLMSDFFAPGVYEILRRLGKRIPEDVRVVGVDNVDYCRFLNPPLTTFQEMRTPLEDGTLLSMLIRQIRNPGVGPEKIYTSLLPILRGSTGA